MTVRGAAGHDHSAGAAGEGIMFPDGFLWGVSTSSHQIEGGNANNDWWEWEHQPGSGCAEPSGDACDSRHRWSEDVAIVGGLGLSAYRFSLEWSRIEPAEGEFSAAELEEYRRLCGACRERGIEPVVTFHHFTLPLWLSHRGGWEAPEAVDRFVRFVSRTGDVLGDLIGLAVTLNEPNVIGVMGYTKGEFPPGVRDLSRHLAVNGTLVDAHRRAVEALRAGPGDYPIGMGLGMDEFTAAPGGEQVKQASEEILENSFLRATDGDDFIGVQCYTRTHLGPEGEAAGDPAVPTTQMGYEYWPQVVEYTVRRAAAVTGLPVVVTENGIATEDDAERVAFLDAALRSLHRCVADGVDVRGYFVWSLLDNFEWTHGYRPKFGLVSVDRDSYARIAKPSAEWYAAVAKANALGPSSL